MFSNDEKVDMLFAYAKCNRNSVLAQNLYIERYPERPIPSIRIFQKLERNLRNNASFNKAKKRKSVVTDAQGHHHLNVLGKSQ